MYVHNPFELDEMFEDAHLAVIRQVFVDYSSGELVQNYWRGQVLYQLEKTK